MVTMLTMLIPNSDGGSWWRERAVVVTGCDSGLGFTLAHWCHDR